MPAPRRRFCDRDIMGSRTIARNSGIGAIDIAIGTMSTLALSVMVARALGPTKLGYYNYLMWVSQISLVFANFGVPAAVGKYAAEYLGARDAGAAVAVIRAGYRYQFVTGVLVAVIGLAVTALAVSPEHRIYTALIVLSIPFAMLLGTTTSMNVAMEDFSANVIPSILSTLLNVVGVVLAIVFGWDINGIATAYLASRVADFSLRYWLGHRRFRAHLRQTCPDVPDGPVPLPGEIHSRFIRFCWQATVLLALEIIVWNRSEVFFLRLFCDIRQVAFYTLTFGIVRSAVKLTEPLGSAMGASLMVEQGRDPARARRLAGHWVRLQTVLVMPITFGLAVIATPLLSVVYGVRYLPAAPVLFVAALLAATATLRNPAQRLIVASDRQDFLLKWGVVTAGLTLTLDLVGVRYGCALGAAYANGISQVVATIGLWWFASTRLRAWVPRRALLLTVGSAAVAVTLAWSVSAWSSPLLRLASMVAIAAVLYPVFIRGLRVLEWEDRARFESLAGALPERFRSPFRSCVRLMVPGQVR